MKKRKKILFTFLRDRRRYWLENNVNPKMHLCMYNVHCIIWNLPCPRSQSLRGHRTWVYAYKLQNRNNYNMCDYCKYLSAKENYIFYIIYVRVYYFFVICIKSFIKCCITSIFNTGFTYNLNQLLIFKHYFSSPQCKLVQVYYTIYTIQ